MYFYKNKFTNKKLSLFLLMNFCPENKFNKFFKTPYLSMYLCLLILFIKERCLTEYKENLQIRYNNLQLLPLHLLFSEEIYAEEMLQVKTHSVTH